jgi:L-cysteine S-thiosulfotransferase
MNAKIALAGSALALLVALGCAQDTKSGRGFHLPPGNADAGRAAFVQLQCHTCHPVDGVELPAPTAQPGILVTLGGEVSRLRTYGELVTAIIHPTRNISDKFHADPKRPIFISPMKEVNGQMTVAQLVDIVTFLETRYRPLPAPPATHVSE